MFDPNDFKDGDDEIAEGCLDMVTLWVVLVCVFIFWGFGADLIHRLIWGAW